MIKKIIYIGNDSFISTKLNRLEITNKNDGSMSSIHFDDIGAIEIDSFSLTLTIRLLRELLNNNIVVIISDENHLPLGTILTINGSHNQTKKIIAQKDSKKPVNKVLWQKVIKQKILNQANVLKKLNKNYNFLIKVSKEVKSGDSSNREAIAAKYYWSELFKEMTKFKREPEGDYPNNMLNYGYIVFRSMMARSIVSSGLHPSLGIFHKNQFNAYCLADDMIEPYRPFIDYIVFQKYNNLPNDLILSKEHKVILLEQIFADCKIENINHPIQIAMQHTANSLAKIYLGETETLLLPNFE